MAAGEVVVEVGCDSKGVKGRWKCWKGGGWCAGVVVPGAFRAAKSAPFGAPLRHGFKPEADVMWRGRRAQHVRGDIRA
jgi:hypothetical protein